jgi:hypothetical protein
MRLALPVIYCKESSVYKMEANVPLNADDCIIKTAIFYNIDLIEELSDSKTQCVLVCGGNEYRINLSFKELDEMIQVEQATIRFLS